MNTHNIDPTKELPTIEKIQHNMPDETLSFDIPVESVDNINYEKPAIRLILDNGNWIEYRKPDKETMRECSFREHQHPDGQYEAFLEDEMEIRGLNIVSNEEFVESVKVSIRYYADLETVGDVESNWETILPSVTSE